jgi:rfaE bifunctional protein kinase chain/domain
MKQQRLRDLIDSFKTKRILVVGDLILDEFVWGKVRRISPEAPVPVVEVDHETYYPGGAANVARNLREFGCATSVLGMVGTDLRARHIAQLLRERQIDTGLLIEDEDYRTIVKTRIIAKHQQVVRVDREQIRGLTLPQMEDALHRLDELLPHLNAIVLEDYGKGLLRQNFVDQVLERARRMGTIVTVDPNPQNRLACRGVTAVTPNRVEAFAAAGEPWVEPLDPAAADQALLTVGRRLLDAWECENLLVTLSEQGMMLFRPGVPPFHIPTRAREVFDVSGAGDTSIALFTLALAGGASAEEAADIANHAGGVVVGKLGTATLTPEELFVSFHQHAGTEL